MKKLHTSKWKIIVSLALVHWAAISVTHAQTNIAVGIPTGTPRNDSYPCAGYGFYAPAGGSTTVNALGYWDASGTGLQEAHTVAIYDYTSSPPYSLILQATIPAGTAAPLINGYRWVGIPTQTLPDNGQGGAYYTIQATQGLDTWTTGIGGSPVLNPFFGTLSGAEYTSGGDTAGNSALYNLIGDLDSTGSSSYGGPNFAYFNPPLAVSPVLVSNIQPASVSAAVGESVVFTAAFSNNPAANLQWQFVNNGTTNNINNGVVNVTNNGVVSSTLTVANVQLASAGSYQLEAVSTSSTATAATSAASLTIIAPIDWIKAGTFTNDSVLTLAGPPSSMLYGVDFGGSGTQTTANGYTFNDAFSSGDVSAAQADYAEYGGYLNGGGTSGDTAMDTMLTFGIYNNGAGPTVLTLTDLVPGQTYNVLALLADTRSVQVDPADGPETPFVAFYGTDGEYVSDRQPYVFPAASPALGGYILGTFTALTTNENVTLVAEDSGGAFGFFGNSQENVLLVTKASPPALTPIYLSEDTVPAIPVVVEGQSLTLTAAFKNVPALNLQWQVIDNGVTNPVTGGVVVNVTNTNNFVVTSTLTITGMQASDTGLSYQLKAVNAANSSDVVYSSAVTVSVYPTISWIGAGIFSNDSVLALAGPVSSEVYGVDFGGSGSQTTTNGYTFADNVVSGNMGVAGGPGSYGGYLTGGATTGDPALDTMLTDGLYGQGGSTGTLSNLTVGQTYDVLVLLDDTRGSAAGGTVFNVEDAVTNSPSQAYAFANGEPAVGGYLLGKFAATATTQALTVFNNPPYATQYNVVLLTKAQPTPPALTTAGVSGGNLILSGTGGTPNASYTLLTATNVATPPGGWTVAGTGTLSGVGALLNSVPISHTAQASYFKVRMP